MNNLSDDILGEIISHTSHSEQMMNQTVSKKWNQLILSKKYLGSYTNFIDACLNNKFLFCDKFDSNLLNDEFTIGHVLCLLLEHYRLAAMIRAKFSDYKIYYGMASTDFLRYGLYNNINKIIKIYIQGVKNETKIYDVNILLNEIKDDDRHKLMLSMISNFDIVTIKNLFISFYFKDRTRVSDASISFSKFITTNGFEYFYGDVDIICRIIKIWPDNFILKFIIDNNLENKIFDIKILYQAIHSNKQNLIKYLINVNQHKYIMMFRRMIRYRKNKYQILLSENVIPECERRFGFIYALNINNLNFCSELITSGFKLNINPICFTMKNFIIIKRYLTYPELYNGVPVLNLPNEIFVHILSFITYLERAMLSRTCTLWHDIVHVNKPKNNYFRAGELRVGEMERDAIIGHGVGIFLKGRLIKIEQTILPL